MSVTGFGFFLWIVRGNLEVHLRFYVFFFLNKISNFTELASCKGLSVVYTFAKEHWLFPRGSKERLTASIGSRTS